jgi:murein L,D-transpeptidase YcbB/YkuD
MAISNDKEFKAALAALDNCDRRQATAYLIRQALDLTQDSRVKAGLDLAVRCDADAAEFATAAAGVNSARVASYTQCGHEASWTCQAAHFVARAAQDLGGWPTVGVSLRPGAKGPAVALLRRRLAAEDDTLS